MTRFTRTDHALAGLAALVLGCGGNVVVGAGGGSGSTGTLTTTCDAHEDCGADGVCLFSLGVCSTPCPSDPSGTCPKGLICDLCATSSCPDCKACMQACAPIEGNSCDDHDDCQDGDACIYSVKACSKKCTTSSDCSSPTPVCKDCVTSSCPGCEDCVSACGI